MATQVSKHSAEGAPKGNQNARKHGWTSARSPAPIADITAAADAAANRDDLATLRRAKRALEFRGMHTEAGRVAQVIELVRLRLREQVNDTLYAPQRLPNIPPGPPIPQTAIAHASPYPDRIARARRSDAETRFQ